MNWHVTSESLIRQKENSMTDNNQNRNEYYPPNQGYYPNQNQYYPPRYQQPYQPPYFDNQQYMMQQEAIQRRNKQKSELRKIGAAIGIALMFYLLIQAESGQLLNQLGLYDLYKTSPVFQSCFSIFAEVLGVALPFGIMALVMRKRYTAPLIPSKPMNKPVAAAWIGVGMAVCIGANYLAAFINIFFSNMGKDATGGKTLSPDSAFACLMEFVAVAIIPPICEEFAMRCCSLGLLRKYGKGFSVFFISLIFGLMHGNIIQFVFAFFVGLILAYVTVQTDSIVPALLIHGFNNGRSALNDSLLYFANEDTATAVTIILTIAWIAAGVIGLIYLASKKELVHRELTQNGPDQLSFSTKFACLIPGTVLPGILLVVLAIYSLTTSTV